MAKNLFESIKDEIPGHIKKSISGKELIEKGFAEDVELACQLNISNSVPLLIEKYYKKI